MIEALWIEAAKLLYELSRKIIERTGRDVVDHVRLKQCVEKYCTNYDDRWCKIKPIGLDRPIELTKVYVPVQFTDRSHLRRSILPDDLQKGFTNRQRFDSFIKQQEKMDGMSVATTTRYLNVLGQPGAGKAHFLDVWD